MTAGAPKGNSNASKGHAYANALRHALENYESKGVKKGNALRKIAEMHIAACLGGDMGAIKELADRLDGKAAQAITGENGGPIQIQDVPWLKTRGL